MSESSDQGDSDQQSESEQQDSSDSEDELTGRNQEEINKLQDEVSLNTYNYDAHINLITKLRSAGELEQLRDAREKMAQVFPLTPKLWLEWIADEKSLAANDEDKLKIVELFERAVGDYVSVDLWLEYGQYSIGLINTSFGMAGARRVLERAVTDVGLHVARGSCVWEVFREFENAVLQTLPIDDPNQISDDIKNQINRVFDIFRRQLSVPLLDMEKTFEECKEWVEMVKEVYSIDLAMTQINSNYQKSNAELQNLKSYEESLTMSDAPHLEQYLRYIEYEEMKGTPPRVFCIFERAILENCLVADLWLRYTKYLDKKVVIDSLITPIYERAVRNCPWSSEIWVNYLRSLERLKSDKEKVLKAFEAGLSVGFQQGEDYRQLWLAYLDFIRRRTDWTDTAQVESLRKNFQKAVEHLSNFSDGDLNCSVQIYQAKVEAKFCKNISLAREIFAEILKRNDIAAQAQVWIEFAKLEQIYGDEKHYRKVLLRGLSSTNDWPESIGQILLNYEREEGNCIEDFDEVVRKYEDVIKRITEKRKIAAEKEVEAKKQLKLMKKQEKYELKRSLKRKINEKNEEKDLKAENVKTGTTKEKQDLKNEPTSPKKKKPEEKTLVDEVEKDQSEQPAHGVTYKSDGSKDLQTVFLSNLDFKITEDAIREVFSQFGQIDDLRLVRNYKGLSKGYCYVEYSSIEGAKEALKHDRIVLESRPVFVSEINKRTQFRYNSELEKHKLFVSNMTPETTKEDLHGIFDKFGSIRDIRIVTYRNGHSKGIAYIEFEDEVSAQEAIQKCNEMLVKGKNIKVVISNPSLSKSSERSAAEKPPLGGGLMFASSSRSHAKPRINAPMIPHSLIRRQATQQNGGTGPPQDEAKLMSNDDFRNMFLR